MSVASFITSLKLTEVYNGPDIVLRFFLDLQLVKCNSVDGMIAHMVEYRLCHQ